MVFALCLWIVGAPPWAAGTEKPVVAILKATDHELVGESFLMNWDRVLSQGTNRTRKIEYFRAEWSRESEQEIETLVRDAVEAALPRLRELMAASGLNLAQVDVGQHSPGGDRQPGSGPDTGLSSPIFVTETLPDIESARGPVAGFAHEGLIDDYA